MILPIPGQGLHLTHKQHSPIPSDRGNQLLAPLQLIAFTLIIIINVVKMIIDTFDLMITIIIFLCNDVITIMVIILATISFTQTRQISKYEVFVSDKPLHG